MKHVFKILAKLTFIFGLIGILLPAAAHASSASDAKHPSDITPSISRTGKAVPQITMGACLEPGVAAFVTGPNEISGTAEVYNGCPSPIVGSFQLLARITDCPGIGTGLGESTTHFQRDSDDTEIKNFGVSAGCVVCDNGIPVEFPKFHVQVTVLNIMGVGTYKGVVYKTGATPSTASTTELLSNSPPEVVPPCP